MFDVGTPVRIILRQPVTTTQSKAVYEIHGTFRALDRLGVYLGPVDGAGDVFVPHDMVAYIVTQ